MIINEYIISSIDSTVVSIASKGELEFITNNVDTKPIMYQIWIGLERNPTNGNYLFSNIILKDLKWFL